MGKVIWITGLSGTGKTTLAKSVQQQFHQKGEKAVLIDGNDVRDMVDDPNCRYDLSSRLVNAYRICRLSRMIAMQGITTVVATISLFHEIHDWNRSNLPGYLEVLLTADMNCIKNREFRGLYSGDHKNVAGNGQNVEIPLQPDLCFENNNGIENIPRLAESIINRII